MVSYGLEFFHRGLSAGHEATHVVDVTTDSRVDGHGAAWQLFGQFFPGLVEASISTISGQGGDELGFGVLGIVGHDVDGVVMASAGRANIDAPSGHGGFQQHRAVVDCGALVAIISHCVAQVDVLAHIVSRDVVVALVFASQNQTTIGVDLDYAEAFSVGHAKIGVVGAGHHGVPGEVLQSIASGCRLIIGFDVSGGDALGLDVRVEGSGLGIGGHGDRNTPASFNIGPNIVGHSGPGLVRILVDAHVAAVVQPVKDLIQPVTVAHEFGQFGIFGVVYEPVDLIEGDGVGGHAGGHVHDPAAANGGQLGPVTDHGHVRIVAVGQFQQG